MGVRVSSEVYLLFCFSKLLKKIYLLFSFLTVLKANGRDTGRNIAILSRLDVYRSYKLLS